MYCKLMYVTGSNVFDNCYLSKNAKSKTISEKMFQTFMRLQKDFGPNVFGVK